MIDQVAGTLFVLSSLLLLTVIAYLIFNRGYKTVCKNVFPPIVNDPETIVLTNFNSDKINWKNEFINVIKPKKFRNKIQASKAKKSDSKKTEIKSSKAGSLSAGSCISRQKVDIKNQKKCFNKIELIGEKPTFREVSVIKMSCATKADDRQIESEKNCVINNKCNTDYKPKEKISKTENEKVNSGVAPIARKRKVMKSYIGLKRKLKELKKFKLLQSGVIEKCDPLSKIKDLDRRIYMLRKSTGYTCLRAICETQEE